MLSYVILIACAIIFYRIGNADYGSGILTCVLSIVMSVLALLFIRVSLVSILAGQILLFIGLTIYNLIRKSPRSGF